MAELCARPERQRTVDYRNFSFQIYWALQGKIAPSLRSSQCLYEDVLNRQVTGDTRWLDIGCGGNFENDFFYLDNFPEDTIKDRQKYFRVDIVNMNDDEADRIGKFDLVRLQHVFEHFTPEEGIRVLGNCAKLLNPDGYILISTPDLKKYVHMYLSGKIKENFPWALTRIEKNSPDSFYFSVFAHSVLHEQHKWCYDIEGLIYQMNATGKFKNITELRITDELAASPFTHNRPHEDVCVLAQLK